MGCAQCREIPEITEENNILFGNREIQKGVITLPRGGVVVQTIIGNIQHGIPPETVKDSMSLGLAVPEYFIVPQYCFDWEDGISLMEFEFPIYYNFFLKKQTKTKLICSEEMENRVRIIFQETLLGPADLSNFSSDFIPNYKGMPDIKKELNHFAKNPFKSGTLYKIDQFIEFIRISPSKHVSIKSKENPKNRVYIKIKDQKILIYNNEEKIAIIEDKILLYQSNFQLYKSLGQEFISEFKPPVLGFTVLGSSHGFDCKGSTSGFIIWINKRGVMIDPPPYSSRVLREQGIPPSFIEKIIISHCHADHDAGAIHKLIEADSIEFLSTDTIMNSFLRKFSAITGLSQEEISQLFQYRTVQIGHPYYILGAKFTFFYSLHSIPTLGFDVTFNNKNFHFSGDTFYDPINLVSLKDNGVLSNERYNFLAKKDFTKYDIIFHEAGIPPIHTPVSNFLDFDEDIKKRIYLIHIAEKDIPVDCGLKGVPLGIKNTLRILNDESIKEDVISNLDLISNVEPIAWVPFPRVFELLSSFKNQTLEKEEILFQQGDFGDYFYVVKEGIIKIWSESNVLFSKNCYRGDYFGESAFENGNRMATAQALTPAVVLKIHKCDFEWIFSFEQKDYPEKPIPLDLLKNLLQIRKSKMGEFLLENSQFVKMTEGQRCLFNMFMKEVQIEEGSNLWNKNEIPKFVYLLKEGKVKIKSNSENDRDFVVVKSGALIGDFNSVFDKKEMQSSCKTMSKTVVYSISAEKLKTFISLYPGLYIGLKDKLLVE